MPKLHMNGIELNYEIAGAGVPIVFIHGLGSSLRDWERQIPFFSEHFQALTLDLRGHGKSQKPGGPYSMALFANDVAELVKALKLPPVHVVGISLGGMVAFQLAVDYPGLIRSLVIVNSGPEFVVRTMKDRWNVFLRFAIVRLLGMRKMGEVLSKRLFVKEEQASLREMFVERWAENDQRAYADTMRAIVGWSVTDRLSKIENPTLVVAAEHDYTPVSVKEAFIPKMSNAKLAVISDSHHATPVDQPEIFNQTVREFLSNH
jgi:3-oxoadipate enol-lactonase